DAIGAGRVPAHPDEERAIVAEIRGPPRLRGGHDRLEVLLQLFKVELLELFAVVVVVAGRVGAAGVLAQHRELRLVGPPVAVGLRLGYGRGRGWNGRVFAFTASFSHFDPSLLW